MIGAQQPTLLNDNIVPNASSLSSFPHPCWKAHTLGGLRLCTPPGTFPEIVVFHQNTLHSRGSFENGLRHPAFTYHLNLDTTGWHAQAEEVALIRKNTFSSLFAQFWKKITETVWHETQNASIPLHYYCRLALSLSASLSSHYGPLSRDKVLSKMDLCSYL